MGYLAIVLMILYVHTGNKLTGLLSLVLGFLAMLKEVFEKK